MTVRLGKNKTKKQNKKTLHLIYIISHYLWLSTQQIYFITEIYFKTQKGYVNQKRRFKAENHFQIIGPIADI